MSEDLLYVYFACLFVSIKRQNGWTDQAQTFLFTIEIEKMFTIEIEDEKNLYYILAEVPGVACRIKKIWNKFRLKNRFWTFF